MNIDVERYSEKTRNFLITYLERCLLDGENPKSISARLGMSITVLDIIKVMLDSEKVLGDSLSISYVVLLYREGLTYEEIAQLRGCSLWSIQHMLQEVTTPHEFKLLRINSKAKRNEVKDLIVFTDIVPLVERHGLEDVRTTLGYTEIYFKRKLMRAKKVGGLLYEGFSS